MSGIGSAYANDDHRGQSPCPNPARLIRDRLGLPPHSPHRPIRQFLPLELKTQNAEVTIKDQVAVTKLRQVFYNPSDQRMEGTFRFSPVPKGARIDKFSMEVNGKMQKAELLDSAKPVRSTRTSFARPWTPPFSNTPVRASSR